MVEYLEKMIPRADLSFFGLGNGFGGKDLELGLRGKGELLRERKRTCGWCFNVWKQKKDPSTCYRIASPDNPEEYPEYPG